MDNETSLSNFLHVHVIRLHWFCYPFLIPLGNICFLVNRCWCGSNQEFYIYVSRYYAIHKDVYSWFDISFDVFGRTSTPQQTEICQSIFKRLLENKWLCEKTMQQVFLVFFM